MSRDGANEGSTELYTASLGNTWCSNCFWELFYTQAMTIKKENNKQIRNGICQSIL